MCDNAKKGLHKESINSGWFDTINICGHDNLSETFQVQSCDVDPSIHDGLIIM